MRRLWWVLVLAACLGGKRPQYDYFVLTPTVASAAPTVATADEPTLSIGQITIPRYLDRESIVTRDGDHRVIYSQRERWAEPLDEALTRTLRQDLAVSLASSGVTVPSHTAAPTFDVDVEILRFERLGNDRVELWARWTLRDDGQAAETHEARIHITIASPTSAAAAAALSQAVDRLASQIAGQVRVAAADRPAAQSSSR